MHTVVARAPGKVVVAGEFAVLEAGHRAVVTAVRRHVTVLLRPAAQRTIHLAGQVAVWRPQGAGVRIAGEGTALRLIESALSAALGTALAEGQHPEAFALEVRSGLFARGRRKLGLGSSAATIVAVVAALLHAVRGTSPSHSEVFRIAAAAHHAVQGGGSGVDVAAATHGGWILYRGFGTAWLEDQLARGRSPADVAALAWPQHEVTELSAPPMPLRVGWTGESASTQQRLAELRGYRTRNPGAYRIFLRESEIAVDALKCALQAGDAARFAAALRLGRAVLDRLSTRLGFPTETTSLRALADAAVLLGGAGKPCGAGGGDCGIAVVPAERWPALQDMWAAAGVEPLDLLANAGGVETRVVKI
ncbi:MAG: phosphomevalonate kinase [Thermaerobacter sp.]|nr:phosphomevalonate kinase [Thermaerobacter sp.]